jgi:hypothetical protein
VEPAQQGHPRLLPGAGRAPAYAGRQGAEAPHCQAKTIDMYTAT